MLYIILLIVGLLMIVVATNSKNVLLGIGFLGLGWFVFIINLIIVFAIIICHHNNYVDFVNHYNQYSKYIKIIENEEAIFQEERALLIENIVYINEKILYHKTYENNFLVGMAVSSKIANLELIDIKRIPKAKTVQYIELNKEQ